MKVWAVKVWVAAWLPSGSVTKISTLPLIKERAVQVTNAVTVVAAPWFTGLGDAVAVSVNVGGATGVTARDAEFGLVPALLVPETT